MRISRTLITLLVALALVAAPVAASTLTSAEPAQPSSGQISIAPWATLLTPPLVPAGLADGAGATGAAGSGAVVPGGGYLPGALGPQPGSAPARRIAAHAAVRNAVAASAREGADVLVDKRRALPARYRPRDLVVPRVDFLGGVQDEGRMLRRRPARALERLFAAAGRDGVALAMVSGFRSFASQQALFSGYASERGVENASHVSARAGHSEHQTGLAVDVSGADGRCAAERCFAGSRPARWLAAHVAAQGFVVRYPRGRERVTGYDYEPWHLRYVGRDLASEVARSGRTLDGLLPRR